ncbi:MAG: hypothetical protein NZM31_00505 [Gemmatales bacterium]|nr:hypothetical protein [Gemmatales bacterium]MDW8385474.1 hypothetical protein [Gemmatales bacterium]
MTWFRVFANSEVVPSPETIAEGVRQTFPHLRLTFTADEEGWLECDLSDPATGKHWLLRRYSRKSDDIRGELQSWAAWVEWQPPSPHQQPIMERLMTAQQVFVFGADADPVSDHLGLTLMQFLADCCNGIYQIDGRGFYAADGQLLLAESD